MHLSTQTLNTGAPQVTVTCRLFGIRVSHTVVLLGLTSMFTDVSSEMVNAILPVYLVLQLGFTPLHFGLFDGMYQGVTAVVRVPAGLMADRRQRYKEVAGAGYALPAACKLGLWAAGPLWVATLGLLVLDRSGKGIRTAPRDALISLSSPPARLTEAFGVHRALDTVGALLGPLAAFALLGLVPAGYDVVFVVSFCLGLVGLGILLSFVANVKDDSGDPGQRSSLRAAVDLFREPGIRGVLFAGAILSVATVSDSLVYLTLQQQTSMDAQYFPLPFMGTSLTYLLLAAPTGRIADRAGRWKLLLAGHIPLGVAYALFLLRSEPGVAKSTGGVVPLECITLAPTA